MAICFESGVIEFVEKLSATRTEWQCMNDANMQLVNRIVMAQVIQLGRVKCGHASIKAGHRPCIQHTHTHSSVFVARALVHQASYVPVSLLWTLLCASTEHWCAIARSHARTDYRRLACMHTPHACVCDVCVAGQPCTAQSETHR